MINDLVTEQEFHFSERWVLFEVSVVLNDLPLISSLSPLTNIGTLSRAQL